MMVQEILITLKHEQTSFCSFICVYTVSVSVVPRLCRAPPQPSTPLQGNVFHCEKLRLWTLCGRRLLLSTGCRKHHHSDEKLWESDSSDAGKAQEDELQRANIVYMSLCGRETYLNPKVMPKFLFHFLSLCSKCSWYKYWFMITVNLINRGQGLKQKHAHG